MKIDVPTRDDVIEVAQNMRANDREEFRATVAVADGDGLPRTLASVYDGMENTFCAYLDEEPIAIGAVVPTDENTIQIGMFATDEFPRIAFALTKFVIKRLLPGYAAQGFSRVECLSVSTYSEAHRWIETLGLARGEELAGYGLNGENFIRFARDL